MILIDTQKKEFNRLREIRIFDKNEDDQKLNGHLLVVGLGGAGSHAVLNLKGMLINEKTPEDNIEFLMFDSDIPAMEQTINDSKEGLGFNATEVISIYRPNLENMLLDETQRAEAVTNLAKWMSPDLAPEVIGTIGAGGNRQVGRLMFSNAYEDVRILLFEKLNEMYRKSASRRLDVILVSSLGGGTGSGMLADLAYNIRAYARSQKMNNFRLGAILMTPDVLFANAKISGGMKDLMKANAAATLSELSYYMSLSSKDEPYVFESSTHRLAMKEDIFDSCMLVSGRKDDQGYVPENNIYMDIAYFMYKLTSSKYIGGEEFGGGHKNLRDIFFRKNDNGPFKSISETDYKIPIREIENLSEYEIFVKVYEEFIKSPLEEPTVQGYIDEAIGEIKTFIEGKPGDEVNLKVNGLINTTFTQHPSYKDIKKNRDTLRSSLKRDVENMKPNISGISKNIETKLWKSIDEMVALCTEKYGPIGVLHIIGAKGFAGIPEDKGLILEVQQLAEKSKNYVPSGEFERTIDSIKEMISKSFGFLTFPAKRKEMENGYYDACLKEALAAERNVLMEGIETADVLGDTVRWLRQVAERIDDLYSTFSADLKDAVEGLATDSKRILSFMLKHSKQSELLPVDYITDERIKDFKNSLIKMFNENKTNIENERPLQIKEYMEKIYKNLFAGIGVFAAEKFIYMSFAPETPTVQEMNALFVAQDSEKRDEVLSKAANAFVQGSREKISRKRLCAVKENADDKHGSRKYISLPEGMPHFSNVVKNLLIADPYNEKENSIAINPGELSITEDDIIYDMQASLLESYEEMLESYEHMKGVRVLHADTQHEWKVG